jgi:hypothetical protein
LTEADESKAAITLIRRNHHEPLRRLSRWVLQTPITMENRSRHIGEAPRRQVDVEVRLERFDLGEPATRRIALDTKSGVGS